MTKYSFEEFCSRARLIQATLQSAYENACLHKSATYNDMIHKGGYEKAIKVIYAYISLQKYQRLRKK